MGHSAPSASRETGRVSPRRRPGRVEDPGPGVGVGDADLRLEAVGVAEDEDGCVAGIEVDGLGAEFVGEDGGVKGTAENAVKDPTGTVQETATEATESVEDVTGGALDDADHASGGVSSGSAAGSQPRAAARARVRRLVSA